MASKATPKTSTKAAEKPAVEDAPTTVSVVAKTTDNNSAVAGVISFSQEQVDLIKRTVADGATNDELALFMHQARRTGLDPLARQLHFVKRQGKMTIQTSIDGFRVVAERSGNYAGQDEPQHFYGKEVKKTSKGRVIPYKTLAKVYKFDQNGQRYLAAVGEAFFDEFKPEGNNAFMWDKMPHTMLAKCAEAQALRKAFPQDLSGLYTDDEMAQAAPADVKPELATDEQRRAFFAIAKDAGFESEDAKERAKTYFKVASFNDITKPQMAAMIGVLEKKAAEKQEKEADKVIEQAEQEGALTTDMPDGDGKVDTSLDDEFSTVR